MFGLLFGTLCLIGLFAVLRRGPHGHGRFGMHRHYYGGRRNWLRGLFVRLDTTPGQEKAIVSALEGLRERSQSLRSELGAARKSVAVAVGGDVLDRDALNEAFSGRAGAVSALRDELDAALSAIHAALDPKQRKTLAELIADGHFGYGWGGHGRDWHGRGCHGHHHHYAY